MVESLLFAEIRTQFTGVEGICTLVGDRFKCAARYTLRQ